MWVDLRVGFRLRLDLALRVGLALELEELAMCQHKELQYDTSANKCLVSANKNFLPLVKKLKKSKNC